VVARVAATTAAFVAIPEGAVGRSFADPPSLPATGGISRGRIEVDSPQPLPSGTVVQAVLSESFRLVSGESAVPDERLEDILLFRADLDGFVEPRPARRASRPRSRSWRRASTRRPSSTRDA
jgi:hypothetical protein